MRSDDAYGVWAPAESPWSPWVKPVLFASEQDWDPSGDPELAVVETPRWLIVVREGAHYRDAGRATASTDTTTAFVIDLPGAEGVAWGVALARSGWRPVPLYNAVTGPRPLMTTMPTAPMAPVDPFGAPLFPPLLTTALVDVWGILGAMRRATAILPDLTLPRARPPVFLLDANRRLGEGFASPGRFDNRSISLPTDFPSAVFLRARGIERVVLVQRSGLDAQEDLAHTLLAWQEGGLSILGKSLGDDAAPAVIQVTRPSMFRVMWHRMQATLGLRRNPLGGFGGTIPVPSAG
jgi:hypothetical protein